MTNTIQIEGMDELIQAVSGGGGGGEGAVVPTPTAQDEGKVLTAGDDGTASWEEATGGSDLPEITGDIDSGKVVMAGWSTSSGTGSYSLENIRQVTDPTNGSIGQVLTRTASASGYGWATLDGLKAFTTQIPLADWTAGTGTHSAPISESLGSILSIYASYQSGYGNSVVVPIKSIYVDSKSEEMEITIDDTYYTPMSQIEEVTLNVKIIYFD